LVLRYLGIAESKRVGLQLNKIMSKLTDTSYYELDEIKREFLKYAPAYARDEARQAIERIYDLQRQGVLRSGLYYIVLMDLVGSTKFAAEHGNKLAGERIQSFITSSFRALNDAHVANISLFVKEIGDAVLFVFQHFPDALKWRAAFDWYLSPDFKHPMQARTYIHIGEVFLEGVNPLSLAVSQTFKMEKTVEAGAIVLTNAAYNVAWPTIARAYHGFNDYGTVELDGYPEPVKLHQLTLNDPEDLKRILEETSE
jgi:class 3 adenylate cyclase